ncbi:unnamed protein product [Rhizophagus irregularis]|nr:unnamed protein product [Rhizophagus irregularis]CAB5360369.1 unnamed protein product [Rhizophagus irregularis]
MTISTLKLLQEHLPRTGFRFEDFSFPSSLGYWISASGFFGILDFGFLGSLDTGFRLPGFFWILDFGFLSSLGY